MHNRITFLVLCAALLPYTASAEGLLSYKPPKLDTLKTTHAGGGTRGLEMPKIQTLAPKSAALTSLDQPVLYWYSSELNPKIIELILIEEGADKPLLEKQITNHAGLTNIRLADNGVKLEQGKSYQWSVSILNDSNNSSATLLYQKPDATLSTIEQKVELGYWYDALDQLILIHSPLANNLLKQIGLDVPTL